MARRRERSRQCALPPCAKRGALAEIASESHAPTRPEQYIEPEPKYLARMRLAIEEHLTTPPSRTGPRERGGSQSGSRACQAPHRDADNIPRRHRSARRGGREGRSQAEGSFGLISQSYFSTRKLPMTRASIPELKKVRSASVGVWTMASPRRLKDVFMSTGTPVIFANSSIKR